MGKQPCCDNGGHSRGPWTGEEDDKLMKFILKNGIPCWRLVPKLAGLMRCGKSCRLRWMNHLRPDLKKGALSEAEEHLLIRLHSQLGNRWSKIATHFPGRTDNEIKNHWNARVKRKLLPEHIKAEGSNYKQSSSKRLAEINDISEMGSNDEIQNSEAIETISMERNGYDTINKVTVAEERYNLDHLQRQNKHQGYDTINKVTVAEERYNLDHLQRQNKHQSHQPRKRSVQIAPLGLGYRFPTARTVQQMMETMDRTTENHSAFNGDGYSSGRTPWEIKESEGDFKVRFDMPGMTKEDVKVWVEEKMLVVKAEKNDNGEDEDQEWPASSYGKYSSRIILPENVEFENIKAEVKDGVLYLTIPKASRNPKIFDINVE